MSLEKKKRKTYKITDKNKKRMGFESAESLSAAHAAQDSATLPDSVFIICLNCFTRWGEIIIHCFDGWCLYALIYRHKAEKTQKCSISIQHKK